MNVGGTGRRAPPVSCATGHCTLPNSRPRISSATGPNITAMTTKMIPAMMADAPHCEFARCDVMTLRVSITAKMNRMEMAPM